MVGRTLSHYRILDRIGEGGMGVVYRAIDTRLDRAVAIKVLTEGRAGGVEWRDRLVREAKAASALNHPHIITVYEIDRADEVDFIAMEYVAGRTLQDIIGGRPLPLSEALKYLSQVADALSVAHDAGIVHRDLKPANIIVGTNGRVKLLDFGLATSRLPADAIGAAPTVTAPLPLTANGTVMGTAAYMSPEQANGDAVDRRTDIWAFGCLLFEALTGRMAFGRRTYAETVARIIEGEADLGLLPATVPPTIRTLIAACLQRDIDRRLRHLDPVWLDAGREPNRTTRSPRWRGRLALGVAGLLIGASVGWIASETRQVAPATASPARFGVRLDHKLRGGAWILPTLTVAPDGSAIVSVGDTGTGGSQLYVRRMDRLDNVALAGTEGASAPFFSPDGRSVGFFAAGKLKRVSLGDGLVQTLCDSRVPYGGVWTRDNTVVFGLGGGPLMRVPASGGTPEPLTTVGNGEAAHRWPTISPDGTVVIYTTSNSTGPGLEEPSLVAQSLSTGRREVLPNVGPFAVFAGDGTQLLTARGGVLSVVPFDAGKLAVTGAPVVLIEGVMQSSSGAAQVSGSSSVLAYLAGALETRRLVWVDRQGHVEPLGAPPRLYVHPRLSPDGQRVAVAIIEPKNDIWIYDIPRGTLSRLTEEGSNAYPIWTPDGTRVTYVSSQQGRPPNLFWKPANGSGPEERLNASDNTQVSETWLPDGKTLLFVELRQPTTGWDILMLSLAGNRQPVEYLKTRFLDGTPQISPSGRLLAYSSDKSGMLEVHLRSFPGPGEELQVSDGGGAQAAWRADEKELYYRTARGAMMVASVRTTPKLSVGKSATLFTGQFANIQGKNYDVTRDGQRFLMIRPDELAAPDQMTVVLNWQDDVKARRR